MPLLGTISRVNLRSDRPLSRRFPPIPHDIRRSINFLSSDTPDRIRAFWKRQMGHLRSLVSGRMGIPQARYAEDPIELSQFRRRYPLDAWAPLMQFCGMGGSHWLGQFAHGFPFTGTLSQKTTLPSKTDKIPAQLPLGEVIESALARFRSRAVRPPPMVDELLREAMGHVSARWLGSHRLISPGGSLADSPQTPLNVSSRIAVAQSSKVRAFDDLEDSLTNRSCAVLTPITLPGLDLFASMSLLITASSRSDWAFLKGEDTSAYKNLPPEPSDSLTAAVGLWNPGW